MPVVGGDEVIGALKAIRADVSVIVMSGYGESEVAEKFAGQMCPVSSRSPSRPRASPRW